MLLAFLILAAILILLFLFEQYAEYQDQRRYPAPGRLILLNDHQLHVTEQGAGGPTVVLESGLAASSLSWVMTPPLLSSFCRVVAYDRAGLGRSKSTSVPVSLSGILADLYALTGTLGLSRPFILAGHSFGGLIAQAFAHLYPERVAGLVLLDPVSLSTYAQPSEVHRRRIQLARRLSRRGALLARFAVVRAALYLVQRGQRRLPSLIGRVTSGKANSTLHRLASEIAKLPAETHAPIRAYWSRPAAFRVMAEYLQLLPAAATQALAMPVPAHIPAIILSAATASPAELIERDEWIQGRPRSRHTQIPGTTHWLQLDRPDLVALAVRELVECDGT